MGQVQPGGILASYQTGTRRRAHGRRGVGVGELHPLTCNASNMRRLVERAAVASQVTPAHVVGEDQDDVGLAGAGRIFSCVSDARTAGQQGDGSRNEADPVQSEPR